MKCTICKGGRSKKGKVTVTLQRNDSIVIIKDVPADVCQDCGEYYLDEATSFKVYAQADDALKRNTEVGIFRYAA